MTSFLTYARGSSGLRSQSAMSKLGSGGRRTLPWAFTGHGALQASSILNSPRAVAMSVYVIRAFIRLREMLDENLIMAKPLAEVDKTLLTHDTALRDIYQKIRPLLLPPDPPRKRSASEKNPKRADKSEGLAFEPVSPLEAPVRIENGRSIRRPRQSCRGF
jgi:hypothetical protein